MPAKEIKVTGGLTSPRGAPNALNDLNLPLTAIDNYVQAGRRLMHRGYADEQTLAELFDKLDGQVSRCYELLRELRQTAKQPQKRG